MYQLSSGLSWVVTILEAEIGCDIRLATEELLKRTDPQGSAGLMFAQYAANPSAYFSPSASRYRDLTLPAGVVQCDVRGSIQVRSHCTVCRHTLLGLTYVLYAAVHHKSSHQCW